MFKVTVATSRKIGETCREWAKENTPEGFEYTDSIDDCDILISVMYGELLSEQFISSKVRCVNFHPGILPEYRGSGAYSWVILNGEKETGVTLHEIDRSIDHGQVIEKRSFPVTEKDTAYSLFVQAEKVMFEMFKDWYESILQGEYTKEEQDESKAAIYYRKDLEEVRDVTRFAKAFCFPGKSNAFYYDSSGQAIELVYRKDKKQ